MRISDWSSDVCSADLQPQPAGTRRGVQEQPADFARAVEVVAQHQYLRVKGAVQLLAMLAVGADAIGIKGPALSDLAEYLTGPAHVAGRGVLKHEQVKQIGRAHV